MKRVGFDYSAIRHGHCEICHRSIYLGMTIFNLELRNGRHGVAHALCESELKKTN